MPCYPSHCAWSSDDAGFRAAPELRRLLPLIHPVNKGLFFSTTVSEIAPDTLILGRNQDVRREGEHGDIPERGIDDAGHAYYGDLGVFGP